MRRFLTRSLLLLALLAAFGYAGLELSFRAFSLSAPEGDSPVDVSVETTDGVRHFGPNRYGINRHGLWEAYVEGDAFNRGLVLGELAKEQVRSQEEHFIAQIRRLVPNSMLLRTLKYGVSFFNRDMGLHVPAEFQREIHGISLAFDRKNDWIAPAYARVMNYHAAHDIGHALQDLSIVGCTSFATWHGSSADSGLVIGRNFDFYMGDDFANDKLVLFVRPDSGHAFASITWAGFMGVVSGMNEHGLTVTLNAAKSAIPTGSKTPISILAREILQYARNIDEAYAIAQRRETFVSESILIGSATDGWAAIIEKSPGAIDLFSTDGERLICSNHYQSDVFKNDLINLDNIRMSDSKYRFDRMEQLLESHSPMSPEGTATVLRDRQGMDGTELGMGNPKAINQLLAHHGVIFQPEKRLMWVSANPFQLGTFVCYDLREIFVGNDARSPTLPLCTDSLNIPADGFLQSADFAAFLRFKELRQRIFELIVFNRGMDLTAEEEKEFLNSNPMSYITHQMLGELYLYREDKTTASRHFCNALGLEVASLAEREWLSKRCGG
jgi:isopenicillin-N N-acyltransferase like protein